MFFLPQHDAHVVACRYRDSISLGRRLADEIARNLVEEWAPRFALAESMEREWPEAFGRKPQAQPLRLVVDNERGAVPTNA